MTNIQDINLNNVQTVIYGLHHKGLNHIIEAAMPLLISWRETTFIGIGDPTFNSLGGVGFIGYFLASLSHFYKQHVP